MMSPDALPSPTPSRQPSQPGVALVLGGATGMLGQALVKQLIKEQWEVHSLGRADGPLDDPGFLQERLGAINPDVLYNTIAYTAVDAAEEQQDEAYALNRSLPALLGRMVKDTSIHLVHYSTDFVFNGKKRTPYTEEDAPDPLNVYGASKLAGEQALLKLELPNCCIVRTAWLFGPGKKNFITTILGAAAERPQLSVVHDQIGSPTFTGDLAVMSIKLAQAKASGVVHAVNSGHASWCELASEAVSLSNSLTNVAPINSEQWPQTARRPAYSVLSTARLTQLTGYTPRPWPQALRDYIFQDEIR